MVRVVVIRLVAGDAPFWLEDDIGLGIRVRRGTMDQTNQSARDVDGHSKRIIKLNTSIHIFRYFKTLSRSNFLE